MCLLGCKFENVAAKPASYANFMGMVAQSFPSHYPETHILRRCAKCGNVETKTIDGVWTLEEINGGTKE